MNKRFQKDKAIAAVTYLLSLSPSKSLDKHWLNLVMYYIERESIIRNGEPMFHDDLSITEYGPVANSVSEGIDSARSVN